ncbi:hypothetical protein CUMW_109260 [Citrus unshiu]|nr:hypothetical protein CUMW_109260 [Citrus unshiu]
MYLPTKAQKLFMEMKDDMFYNINNVVNDKVDNLKIVEGFNQQKELHDSKFASTPSADVSFKNGISNSTSCKPSIEQGSSLTT